MEEASVAGWLMFVLAPLWRDDYAEELRGCDWAGAAAFELAAAAAVRRGAGVGRQKAATSSTAYSISLVACFFTLAPAFWCALLQQRREHTDIYVSTC